MADKPDPLGERELSRIAMRLAEEAVIPPGAGGESANHGPASPILQRLPPWSGVNSRSHRVRGASRRDQSDVASSAARLLLPEGAASTRHSGASAGVTNSIRACTPHALTALRAATPVSAKRSRSALLTRLTTGESK
jgi:hypothetical protein